VAGKKKHGGGYFKTFLGATQTNNWSVGGEGTRRWLMRQKEKGVKGERPGEKRRLDRIETGQNWSNMRNKRRF